MKLYLFPPSPRVLGIVALKNHLALDCELQTIDLGHGDQLTAQYVALNPNKKMPTLEDDGSCSGSPTQFCFTWPPRRGALAVRFEGSSRGSSLARLAKRSLGCRVVGYGRF